jgi:hypothetical protein
MYLYYTDTQKIFIVKNYKYFYNIPIIQNFTSSDKFISNFNELRTDFLCTYGQTHTYPTYSRNMFVYILYIKYGVFKFSLDQYLFQNLKNFDIYLDNFELLSKKLKYTEFIPLSKIPILKRYFLE